MTKTVKLQITLYIETKGTDDLVEEFLQDMNYSFDSNHEDVKIIDTEINDWEIKDDS